MNIVPISSNSAITPFRSAFAPEKAAKDPGVFKTMLDDAVSTLEGLNDIKNQDSVALSLGNLDDIGQMQINGQKAEVALQMLVQIRNRLLDGYSEIMRTNV